MKFSMYLSKFDMYNVEYVLFYLLHDCIAQQHLFWVQKVKIKMNIQIDNEKMLIFFVAVVVVVYCQFCYLKYFALLRFCRWKYNRKI